MTKGRVVCLVCLLVLLGVSVPAAVRAQAGSIEIFGDPVFTNCAVTDVRGLVPVYVAHRFSSPALGARFMIDLSGSMMTCLGESSAFARMGDSVTGVTICYGACLSGPQILILTVNFFGSGTTPACTFITVEPHPEDGQILALDCSWNLMFPTGGAAVINPNANCNCTSCLACGRETGETPAAEDHFCAWVPVQQSTWGAIKSMYE